MEVNLKFLEVDLKFMDKIWNSYFSCLQIEDNEYEIYGKIIKKIRENDLEFSEEDINNILKLIKIFYLECDYYEIKKLEILEEQLLLIKK